MVNGTAEGHKTTSDIDTEKKKREQIHSIEELCKKEIQVI